MILADEKAFSFLKGSNSLLDSKLVSINIDGAGDGVRVSLIFNARSEADYKSVKLTFINVSEFGFYHSSNFYFYNVENLKFIHLEDGDFYLAMDPDVRLEGRSGEDGDFIKAKSLELQLREPKGSETLADE